MLISVTCLEPIVSNWTNTWTDRDKQVFTRSLVRCEEKFPNSPCLNTFTKKEEGAFSARCKDPYYFCKHVPQQRVPAFLAPR